MKGKDLCRKGERSVQVKLALFICGDDEGGGGGGCVVNEKISVVRENDRYG